MWPSWYGRGREDARVFISTMKVLFIEPTPNPDALKFNVDGRLIPAGYLSYEDRDAAARDPLAAALFDIDAVRSVFLMPAFVTVTIAPDGDWWTLKPRIQAAIEASADAAEAPAPATTPQGVSPGADDRLGQIAELFDSKIRPALAGDGGGLEIVALEGDELRIRYQGACGSCPSAISGTLRAIQDMLRIEVDPGLRVVAA